MSQFIPQAHAQLKDFTNYDPSVTNPPPALLQDLEVVFNNIVQVVLYLAGIVAFIYLLIGGFHYLNAGGDPKTAARARATITYAVWGLILVVVAWTVLRLIERFTGVPVTIFKVNVAASP
jgi:hypothetical protein